MLGAFDHIYMLICALEILNIIIIIYCSEPIRFVRFDNESVNRGLTVLEAARCLDSWRRREGSQPLETRLWIDHLQNRKQNRALKCSRAKRTIKFQEWLVPRTVAIFDFQARLCTLLIQRSFANQTRKQLGASAMNYNVLRHLLQVARSFDSQKTAG